MCVCAWICMSPSLDVSVSVMNLFCISFCCSLLLFNWVSQISPVVFIMVTHCYPPFLSLSPFTQTYRRSSLSLICPSIAYLSVDWGKICESHLSALCGNDYSSLLLTFSSWQLSSGQKLSHLSSCCPCRTVQTFTNSHWKKENTCISMKGHTVYLWAFLKS